MAVRKLVLIADDEAIVALDVQGLLRQAGYDTVGPAASADRAIALIDIARPDAAVLDLNLLHGTSGPVADRLEREGVPFVFVTGDDSDKVPGPHRHRPFLSKPFREEEFLAAVAALCR